jgi:hypothetical protein
MAGDWTRALDMVDCQLAMAPMQLELHVEKGDLWSRLGAREMARESYQAGQTLSRGQNVDERLLKLLGQRLGDSDPGSTTLH